MGWPWNWDIYDWIGWSMALGWLVYLWILDRKARKAISDRRKP